MKKERLLTGIIPLFVILSFFCLQGCQNKKKHEQPAPRANVSKKAQDAKSYIYGKVKKTMDSGGYTYMLLEFEGNDFWVAVPQMKVSIGQEVMLLPGETMKDFHSRSLNKTFETIIFSQGPASAPLERNLAETKGAAAAHSGAPRLAKLNLHLKPATGAGAVTIEAAYKQAKKLDGKQVVLKAQVVKISKNILGKNWLHCQDGTGTEKDKNFDITVTTTAAPKVGALVLIKGTLKADRDIGAGYFYPVIIEDANVTEIKR